MSNPTLHLEKRNLNGAPAVCLIVRFANAELRPILDGLGVLPDCTLANYRSITCTTPAALDAVRTPLKAYFGAKGEWIGA